MFAHTREALAKRGASTDALLLLTLQKAIGGRCPKVDDATVYAADAKLEAADDATALVAERRAAPDVMDYVDQSGNRAHAAVGRSLFMPIVAELGTGEDTCALTFSRWWQLHRKAMQAITKNPSLAVASAWMPMPGGVGRGGQVRDSVGMAALTCFDGLAVSSTLSEHERQLAQAPYSRRTPQFVAKAISRAMHATSSLVHMVLTDYAKRYLGGSAAQLASSTSCDPLGGWILLAMLYELLGTRQTDVQQINKAVRTLASITPASSQSAARTSLRVAVETTAHLISDYTQLAGSSRSSGGAPLDLGFIYTIAGNAVLAITADVMPVTRTQAPTHEVGKHLASGEFEAYYRAAIIAVERALVDLRSGNETGNGSGSGGGGGRRNSGGGRSGGGSRNGGRHRGGSGTRKTRGGGRSDAPGSRSTEYRQYTAHLLRVFGAMPAGTIDLDQYRDLHREASRATGVRPVLTLDEFADDDHRHLFDARFPRYHQARVLELLANEDPTPFATRGSQGEGKHEN